MKLRTVQLPHFSRYFITSLNKHDKNKCRPIPNNGGQNKPVVAVQELKDRDSFDDRIFAATSSL